MTDLHLSDRPGTATAAALDWAVGFVNETAPDFLVVSGDVTTYGTRRSAERLVDAITRVQVPVLMTPGNSERRDPGALPVLDDLCRPGSRVHVDRGLLVLLPDTSTGSLPQAERDLLTGAAVENTGASRRIVVTHYPIDRLEPDSRSWLDAWVQGNAVELFVAGHTHRHESDNRTGCLEVVSRGLDPDKAIGDLPGLSLFETERRGVWLESSHPWSPAIELLPSDLAGGAPLVGRSIQGDPIAAAHDALELGHSCLEIRPAELDFSRVALRQGVRRLRAHGPFYLSYHLPELRWTSDTGEITGVEALWEHLEVALDLRVDGLTIHVPRAAAGDMESDSADRPMPSALYDEFLVLFEDLFGRYVRGGGRLAVEHIHNPPSTAAADPGRAFATDIEAYTRWIDAVGRSIGLDGPGLVGALLDLGHARNNGGELDNLQPLGDWYAAVGRRILGYHIHQVDVDPAKARLSNHLPMAGLFGPRISYAGFLWAWSTRQITRGPLFVEVRDPEGANRTAALVKRLFDDAEAIRGAADLPGRRPAGG